MTLTPGERAAHVMFTLRCYAGMEEMLRGVIARDLRHYVIRDGEVLLDDDGKPVHDPRPAREAQDLLKAIARDRARLTGRAVPGD